MGLPHYSMDDPESDYHNFSQTPSSNHRLPTLNGVQALLDAVEKHRPISTNLITLDSILCESSSGISQNGGVSRGGVTELYGAPGSGKTHIAMQLAANALLQSSNSRVVWIDTATRFPKSRLKELLEGSIRDQPVDEDTITEVPDGAEEVQDLPWQERLIHYYIPNLTQLLAILMHPSRDFFPEGTTLLVIDDFSGVVMDGLPQDERINTSASTEARQSLSHENIISKNIAVRRAAMLSAISAGLARLAASYSIAVVVTSKATSNRKSGTKIATMKSILASSQWNENVAVRIVIYRMFWPKLDRTAWTRAVKRKQRIREKHALRVAEIERLGGKDVQVEGVRFVILTVSVLLQGLPLFTNRHSQNRLQAVDPPKPVEILDVVLPSSPPAPTQENEEAMGNLGLEDAREEDDQSVQMPEDIPASSNQIFSQASKRKVSEIADSEDEDELDSDADSGKISRMKYTTGFLPSSQVSVDEDGSVTADHGTIGHQQNGHDNSDDEEMLIKD